MLSLKSLCLLKVFSLHLPLSELPIELSSELRKMEIFNGNFYDEPEKKSVITIQYQGGGTWQFWIKYKFTQCWAHHCRDICVKKCYLHHFVIKENEPCMIPVVTSIVNFGLAGILESKADASTVMRFERESASSQLIFTTVLPAPGEHQVISRLIMISSRCLTIKMSLSAPVKPRAWYESQVSAKDAFPEPVGDCDNTVNGDDQDDD